MDVETLPGVRCQQVTRPIARRLIYSGGSAPLFSTVLMLANASTHRRLPVVVLCSPPPIADEILYAAQLCGGAISLTSAARRRLPPWRSAPNRWRRSIKSFGQRLRDRSQRQVSQRLDGAVIDMPAGPSEVLVIADSGATPISSRPTCFSQAEHGPDSQVSC